MDENLAWLTQKTEESKCNFEGGSNYGMIWSTYIITIKNSVMPSAGTRQSKRRIDGISVNGFLLKGYLLTVNLLVKIQWRQEKNSGSFCQVLDWSPFIRKGHGQVLQKSKIVIAFILQNSGFQWILRNFQKKNFTQHLWTTASIVFTIPSLQLHVQS